MIIAGIEEAGRGPAIGPMVMCIVVIDDSFIENLLYLGVKDSKQLRPQKRKSIFKQLINEIKYKVRIIPPSEIDQCLKSKDSNLNWMEAKISAELTNDMFKHYDIKKIFLDCPSNNLNSYAEYYLNLLNKKIEDIELICEHKADINYPVVSAASIIAKVIRDEEIEKIKNKYNIDFGSGYTSDQTTINFLKNWYSKYKSFPEFVRKSWKTIDKIIEETKQIKLNSYFKK